MVFPTFFNLSLNLAIRSLWSEPQSALCLIFVDCIELLHLGWKEYNQSGFLLSIWWCPCLKSSVVLWKRVFAMISVFSWQNSVSPFPASFCIPRPNLPVNPGISWLPTLINLENILKSRDITLPTKVHQSNYGFSSSHVQIWELDHKESWPLKNWCFWTVVLEKILESPFYWKKIKPVHSKGNQSLIFTGRTDSEGGTPILWLADEKSWLTGKDHDAGKDWVQEEKGMKEDEIVGWYHWPDGHGFEKAPGVGDGQGILAWCSHGVAKDQTWLSDWTEMNYIKYVFIEELYLPP